MTASNNSAIVLQDNQQPGFTDQLLALNFADITSRQIIEIGLESERGLQTTLDGFLDKLDKKTAAQVFALFSRLEQGVDNAKLPELLAKIQEKPRSSLLGRWLAKFRGKSRDEIIQELMGELGDLIAGRTETLADEMKDIQTDLETEMNALANALTALEELKIEYLTHVDTFAVSAAVAGTFYNNSVQVVANERAGTAKDDLVGQARVGDYDKKLELLRSRALALEGVYTRLPADAEVISQIQQAGISTLQETATTVGQRLASIKITLLAINGAFQVSTVQQLSDKLNTMDNQLEKIRAQATQQVAVTAAKAPGENRLAQAQRIADVITATTQLKALVDTAKKETIAQFETAQKMFAQSRNDLALLRAG